MTLRLVFALALAAAACSHADETSPFHPCSVSDWRIVRVHDIEGCTCDPGFVWPDDLEGVEVARGTATGLVAPPGSFPGGTVIRAESEAGEHRTFADAEGSAYLRIVLEDGDLTGTSVLVEAGGRTFRVPLERFDEARFIPGPSDAMFPERALAIEDPPGTMRIRGELVPSTAVGPLEHFGVLTTVFGVVLGGPVWTDELPVPHELFETTTPGHVAQPFGVVMVHAGGRASGCGLRAQSICTCSVPSIAAGSCVPPEPIDVASVATPPPDAGMPDAGPSLPPD
jgi:hypothetical protein